MEENITNIEQNTAKPSWVRMLGVRYLIGSMVLLPMVMFSPFLAMMVESTLGHVLLLGLIIITSLSFPIGAYVGLRSGNNENFSKLEKWIVLLPAVLLLFTILFGITAFKYSNYIRHKNIVFFTTQRKLSLATVNEDVKNIMSTASESNKNILRYRCNGKNTETEFENCLQLVIELKPEEGSSTQSIVEANSDFVEKLTSSENIKSQAFLELNFFISSSTQNVYDYIICSEKKDRFEKEIFTLANSRLSCYEDVLPKNSPRMVSFFNN
jgi:hypothetical protein